MPKIEYVEKNFRASTLAMIGKVNTIIAEYATQGFDLTLRQLYYQFVARDLLPNTLEAYNKLGRVVNSGRLAGRIDWDRIVDRTRNVQANSHWDSPADILRSAASSYRIDKWADQPHRIEVWIEKEALVGIIEGVCNKLDIPFLACRGYLSQSEAWRAAIRMAHWDRDGQEPYIIHLGDHDPSGLDMTEDIRRRMEMFDVYMNVNRIALNRDQVDVFNPPPNPAKLTDSRVEEYVAKFGYESWELDALPPAEIASLIEKTVKGLRDAKKWKAACEKEADQRERLQEVADGWEEE